MSEAEHEERRGNLWRWRCAWVGHLYVGITSYPFGTTGVACLRCHGVGWKRPTFEDVDAANRPA